MLGCIVTDTIEFSLRFLKLKSVTANEMCLFILFKILYVNKIHVLFNHSY